MALLNFRKHCEIDFQYFPLLKRKLNDDFTKTLWIGRTRASKLMKVRTEECVLLGAILPLFFLLAFWLDNVS